MHTPTSADNPIGRGLGPPTAITKPGNIIVVQIAEWETPNFGLPPRTSPLDKVVAQYETDPKRRTALHKARAQLAGSLSQSKQKTLRTYRLEKGLSQAALALEIGSTQAQIARIESGKQDVQIGTVVRFAEAIGLNPLDAIRAFLIQRDSQGA
jgi:ribosome-binding protein aMBF1 (putative translation factor)